MLVRDFAIGFSSPRGDKLQYGKSPAASCASGFRPLAGINCNPAFRDCTAIRSCFRPLAGINCNNRHQRMAAEHPRFSSPRGDKLQSKSFEEHGFVLGFSSPRGDKLQWQTLLTNHENLPQKAESCTFQQHYTSFYCKRKELFGQRGGFRWCEPVTEVRKKVCRTGWLAPHLRRRSANGVEKISHKDHLNSAEGASKP